MFGTINGGPVVNVLSTGVLTIPMMVKRGFSRVFAGGVEAAASLWWIYYATCYGGSSLYPRLYDRCAIPRCDYCCHAASDCYFICLFLSASFQSRKQNIEAFGKLTEEMYITREDILYLCQIFLPILSSSYFANTKGLSRLRASGVVAGRRENIGEQALLDCLTAWVLQLVQNSAGDAGATG